MKIFSRFKQYFFNLFSNENHNQSNDINTPKNNNQNNINQPTSPHRKDKDSKKTKKVIWITVSVLIGLGLLALIIVSILGSGPRRYEYTNIINVTTDNYTLLNDKNGANDDKVINESKFKYPPQIYYGPRNEIRIAYGNNFNGFYYIATLTNYTVQSSTENSQNTEISLPSLIIGNYLVTTTGELFNEVNGSWSYVPTGKDFLLARHLKGFNSKIQVPESGFDWTILFNFLPIIISVIFFIFLIRMMRNAGQGNMGKTTAKVSESNVKFTDVAGIEEEKGELIELVDYLKHPQKYVEMGARIPKGCILYGPPGTGKTLLAKAVAGEAQVPFFQASGSSFEEMLVGVGASRVRDLFNKAIKASPSIIFIDEIDSLGSKRGKFEMSSATDQTLNQLLAEMDGFSSRTGVIVIAATNRLSVLDDALLRPGRFDRHIQVNLPDIKERAAILKIHAKNKNLSSSIDLEDIARRTPGFSGAQLENVLNESTLLAVRKNKKTISIEDLDEAIDRVIAGPAKTTRIISPEEKKQIAYHEAGHALVGLHIKGGDVVQKITIIPRGQAAGYTLSVPEKQELSIQKKSDLLGLISSTLGGRAAEEIIFGKQSVSTGASNDLYKVTNIVRSMVMQLGMSDVGLTQFVPSEGVANPYQQKLFSEQTSLIIDKEIEKIIKKQYDVASEIIKKNKKELDLIVESLLIMETIVKPQIDYIHKNLKLPPEIQKKKNEIQEKNKDKKTPTNIKK